MLDQHETGEQALEPLPEKQRDTKRLSAILVGGVVAAIVLVVAIPNILRYRIQRNESGAIGDLRKIIGADIVHKEAHGVYATTFDELQREQEDGSRLLEGDWSKPRNGYVFTLSGDTDCFELQAIPEIPNWTGLREFYTDCTGIIYLNPEKIPFHPDDEY